MGRQRWWHKQPKLGYGAQGDFKEKLTEAFSIMRKQGFYARQNFMCCGSCGAYSLGQLEKAHPKKLGSVWYNRQSTDNIQDGCVYISFGESEHHPELSREAVGHRLSAALRSAGLEPDWDGDGSRCVLARYFPES